MWQMESCVRATNCGHGTLTPRHDSALSVRRVCARQPRCRAPAGSARWRHRPAPGFRTIDGASDVVFATKPEPPIDRALISNETMAAVDSAFNTLAHTIIGQNARTLEDLVKEMLRPMLQHWLDNNLPTLVERLVRQEIERVARGR